jgi:hypothetical protein
MIQQAPPFRRMLAEEPRMPAVGTVLRLVVLLTASLFAIGRASAQCEPGWARGFYRSGSDGAVTTSLAHDDGSGPALYAAGSFYHVGNAEALGIAKWDGRRWAPLGSGIVGGTFCMAEYAGELYVGGALTSAGGIPVARLARWDGQSWSAVGAGLPNVAWVATMIVYGGELWVASSIPASGGGLIGRIDRWDGQQWTFVMTISDTPMSLALHQGEMYLGGTLVLGGQTVSRVTRWTGTFWAPVGAGLGLWPRALKSFDGQLFAAGNPAGTGSSVKRWDGANWLDASAGLESVPPYGAAVSDLLEFEGQLYASGGFHPEIGSAFNLARWNGASWDSIGAPISDGIISTLCEFDGALCAGGSPTEPLFGIGRLIDGAWTPLQPGINAPVTGIVEYGGETYLAGEFNLRGSGTSDLFVRGEGATWSAIDGAPSGDVGPMLIFRGRLCASGCWKYSVDACAYGLARWNGTQWSVSYDAPAEFRALAVYQNDLFGGGFDWSNPVVWRWNGTYWTPAAQFEGISRHDGILSMAVYHDELYVSGLFATVDGVPADGMARFDGHRWAAVGDFGPGASNALCTYQDELYAGGYWNGPDGNIARWDGSTWRSVAEGVEGSVVTMGVHDDRLVVAGYFNAAGGEYADGLATWDGQQWEAIPGRFDVPPSVIAGIGENLYFGGYFSTLDDQPMYYFARRTPVLPLEGNMDRDGDVDLSDLTILIGNFGASGVGPTDGDANGDGVVDIQDLAIALAQFGSTCP